MPIAYLIAGASTVIVLAVVVIGSMSKKAGIPDDPDAAIKSARSFMIQRSSVYAGKRTLMVDKPPTAKRVSDGYMVYGKVGFRPAPGKEPPSFSPWECHVKYDTVKKAWHVQDFKP